MNLTDIRCGQCGRKLAAGRYIEISIKCPRCGALNHLKAVEHHNKNASERQKA